jgi:hypothetical protein
MNRKKFSIRGVSAACAILSVLLATSCDVASAVVANLSPKGVYVGVIAATANQSKGYAQDLVKNSNTGYSPIVSNLLYLNDTDGFGAQKNILKTTVLNEYSADSTDGKPLYYAVHKALNSLKSEEPYLVASLENITVVTFTDGYDTGSGMLTNDANSQYIISGVPHNISDDAYGDWLKNQIRGGMKISNIPITAYAVAVKSSATGGGRPDQTAQLQKIASSDDDVFLVDNWNAVALKDTFSKIANSLTSISYNSLLYLDVNSPSSYTDIVSNPNIAITFDGAAPDATKTLLGKVIQDGSKFSITAITTTSDLNSINGTVQGKVAGLNTRFTFPGFTGAKTGSTVKIYKRVGSAWVEQTTGVSHGFTQTTVEQKSAIIYFVLDAKLNAANVGTIKTAVSGFIDTLYDISNQS